MGRRAALSRLLVAAHPMRLLAALPAVLALLAAAGAQGGVGPVVVHFHNNGPAPVEIHWQTLAGPGTLPTRLLAPAEAWGQQTYAGQRWLSSLPPVPGRAFCSPPVAPGGPYSLAPPPPPHHAAAIQLS
jgi:hypothetical protein